MNKKIILDIETTGLNPFKGDRIIEIGCVEIINRKITNNILHIYINPERDSSLEAIKIHGLTTNFLKNKPKFHEIFLKFYHFIYNKEIIIHNALFDINFLNQEFKMLNLQPFKIYTKNIIDTLKIAKKKFPKKRNSLDALCKRYNILNNNRNLHGALIDAKLLAKVYLYLTIKQKKIFNNIKLNKNKIIDKKFFFYKKKNKYKIKIILANNNEISKHKKIMNNIKNIK